MVGGDPRNAVVLIGTERARMRNVFPIRSCEPRCGLTMCVQSCVSDPCIDPNEALLPFHALEIEKVVSPIDPRLGCGDANQFIARCCPRNLIVPYEYTVDPASSGGGDVKSELVELSHFSRVMPLNELTTAKPKMDLLTQPMKILEPIALDKSQKYIDGRLDPNVSCDTARVT